MSLSPDALYYVHFAVCGVKLVFTALIKLSVCISVYTFYAQQNYILLFFNTFYTMRHIDVAIWRIILENYRNNNWLYFVIFKETLFYLSFAVIIILL